MIELESIEITIMLSVLVWGIKASTSVILEIFSVKIPSNQMFIESLATKDFLVIMIILTIMAPFVEEIIFRYIIQKTLKRFRSMCSILISSVLFSLMHYQGGDIIPIINYFISGLCLATIYDRSENIAITYTVHRINNFVNLLFLNIL